MSNRPPHWANDDDTRLFAPTPSQTPSSRQPGSPVAGTSRVSRSTPGTPSSRPTQQVGSGAGVQGASPRASQKPRTLVAGRFDAAGTLSNLGILAGLAGVITFAVILVVDQVLAATTDTPAQPISSIVVPSIVTVTMGVGAGVAYIPVVGTGNENLFGVAVIAIAVAAATSWVVFGGLLAGDFSRIPVLAGIICTAVAAYGAPSRIEAARMR